MSLENYQIDTNFPTDRRVTDGANLQVTFLCNTDNANLEQEIPRESNDSTPAKQKVCRYFKSNGKCREGFHCKFSHCEMVNESIPMSNTEFKETNTDSKQRVCRYFQSNGKCRDSSACKFAHYEATNGNAPINSTENSDLCQDEKILPNVEQEPEKSSPNKQRNNLKQNSRKSCPYFEAPSGCRNGDDCKFQHYRATADAGEQNSLPISSADKSKNNESQVSHEFEPVQQDKQHFKNVGVDDKTHHYRRKKKPDEKINVPNVKSKDDSIPKSTTQCKYYMQGRCNREGCHFSHDGTPLLPLSDTVTEQKTFQTDANMPEKVHDITANAHDTGNVNKYKFVANHLTQHQNFQKTPVICKYYNSEKGCSRENCRYLHVYYEEDEQRIESIEIPYKDFRNNFESLHINEEPYAQAKSTGIDNGNEQKLNIEPAAQKENDKRIKRKLTKCRYGDKCFKKESCPFGHDEDGQNSKNHQKICPFYLSSKGCMNGDSCSDVHSDILHKPGLSIVPKETDFFGLRKTELSQLEKRFSGGKCSLIAKEPNTVYQFIFTPTDPDWVSVMKSFCV